jgi:hypothetical protein
MLPTPNNIKKKLKSNPNAFIYYDDNGSWTLYKSKEHFTQAEKESDRIDFERSGYEEKYQKTWAKAVVMSGSDDDFSEGYAPALVIAMATLLGMEVDSI